MAKNKNLCSCENHNEIYKSKPSHSKIPTPSINLLPSTKLPKSPLNLSHKSIHPLRKSHQNMPKIFQITPNEAQIFTKIPDTSTTQKSTGSARQIRSMPHRKFSDSYKSSETTCSLSNKTHSKVNKVPANPYYRYKDNTQISKSSINRSIRPQQFHSGLYSTSRHRSPKILPTLPISNDHPSKTTRRCLALEDIVYLNNYGLSTVGNK
mmetsp:Transcript_24184/g.24112  ORF Transcript_24184/g.24112 Transcript_24184/m.24112 type:complete len:208 (+) Transcript_24184:1251-1874(+)